MAKCIYDQDWRAGFDAKQIGASDFAADASSELGMTCKPGQVAIGPGRVETTLRVRHGGASLSNQPAATQVPDSLVRLGKN